MLKTYLKRIVRSGTVGFARNSFVSLSSVLMITITLFVVGSLIFFSSLFVLYGLADAHAAELSFSPADAHFEITNSPFRDIIVDSSVPIRLHIESLPDVTALLFPTTSAASAVITVRGLDPETRYFKYQDGYRNGIEFRTDASGAFSYTQDLSVPRTVFIQKNHTTTFITDDATGGDCAAIGVWNAGTKTCVLTRDVFETIEIARDGVTLDGAGYTVNGGGSGTFGVNATGRTSITIKSLYIAGFNSGLWMPFSHNNTITDTTLVGNGVGLLCSLSRMAMRCAR